MKQFETKVVLLNDTKHVICRDPYGDGESFINPDGKTVQDQLSEYGEQGWQVAHVFRWDNGGARILLQREKPGHPYRG